MKERNLAGPRANLARSAWSRGACRTWTSRPLLEGAGQVFHLAAQAGVRASWGREFARLHRPQRARHPAAAGGGPGRRGCRASCTPRPRRSTATRPACRCARTRAASPLSPYGVTKLAAEHLATLYETQPRPAGREPALLHGLRAPAAAGHGVPQVPEGVPRRRAHPRLRRRPRRRATSPSSRDIVAATRAAGDSGRPGCVYNVGGGERIALDDVLRADRGRHRPARRRSCARRPRKAT